MPLSPQEPSSIWMLPHSWCCFMSLASSFLSHPVLDIFFDPNIDKDFISKGVEGDRLRFFTQMPVPNEEGGDNIIKGRFSRVDTVFLAHNLPLFQLTGEHGRVVLITDNITVADPLWFRNRLIDVVIIILSNHNADAYTWFPYEPTSCHSNPNLELLGSCNASCAWNANLFPEKLPNKFSGCPIRLDSFEFSPFVNRLPNGTLTGLEVTLMETLTTSFEFSVTYIDDPIFFPPVIEGKVAGCMAMLISGEADFAYSTTVMQEGYYVYAQPLVSFREGIVTWILPTPKPKPLTSGMYSGFSNTLWSIIVGTVFIISITSKVLTVLKNDRWIWVDMIALTVASPLTRMAMSSVISIFLLLAQFYSLHIAWFYQSTLLINLYNTPYEKPVQTLKEALDSGLTGLLLEFLAHTFNETDHDQWNRLLQPGRHEMGDVFDFKLLVEEKSVFVMSLLIRDSVTMRKMYPHLALTEMFYTVPDSLANFPVTAYGRRGSPLTNRFARKMLHLVESGLFKFWMNMDPDFAPFTAKKKNTTKPLNLEMLQAIFYVLIVFILLSALIFLVEVSSRHFKLWKMLFATEITPKIVEEGYGKRKVVYENRTVKWKGK